MIICHCCDRSLVLLLASGKIICFCSGFKVCRSCRCTFPKTWQFKILNASDPFQLTLKSEIQNKPADASVTLIRRLMSGEKGMCCMDFVWIRERERERNTSLSVYLPPSPLWHDQVKRTELRYSCCCFTTAPVRMRFHPVAIPLPPEHFFFPSHVFTSPPRLMFFSCLFSSFNHQNILKLKSG